MEIISILRPVPLPKDIKFVMKEILVQTILLILTHSNLPACGTMLWSGHGEDTFLIWLNN